MFEFVTSKITSLCTGAIVDIAKPNQKEQMHIPEAEVQNPHAVIDAVIIRNAPRLTRAEFVQCR